MLVQPGEVALQRRCGNDREEARLGQPRDREVAFDAAALVEHLGVDDAARRDVDLVGANPLQEGERILALDPDFSKRRHVE